MEEVLDEWFDFETDNQSETRSMSTMSSESKGLDTVSTRLVFNTDKNRFSGNSSKNSSKNSGRTKVNQWDTGDQHKIRGPLSKQGNVEKGKSTLTESNLEALQRQLAAVTGKSNEEVIARKKDSDNIHKTLEVMTKTVCQQQEQMTGMEQQQRQIQQTQVEQLRVMQSILSMLNGQGTLQESQRDMNQIMSRVNATSNSGQAYQVSQTQSTPTENEN